jgi:pimeloyl-ACP methyl ester carboxylesterase
MATTSPLAYLSDGTGDAAVIFVHGMCQASIFWEPTLRELPPGFRGYAVDLPGFGDSHDVPGPYSIASHAEAVQTFLVAHDLHDVILVGNSMGGVVCQTVAVRHPERLAKLVLVSTGPCTADPAAALAAADREEQGTWDRAAAADYVEHFFVRPPADLEPYVDAAFKATHRARVDTRRSSARTDLRPDLGRISVPTLIVQGERDGSRTPEVGAMMAGLIPDAELHVVDGVGHTPMLEDPATWRQVFHQFITPGPRS